MVFIDNWQTFWKRHGLIRRDGIHPTLDGTTLISRNLAKYILDPKPRKARVEARRQSCSPTRFSVLPLGQLPAKNPTETVSVPRPPNLVKYSAMKRGVSHKNLIKINTTNDVSKQSLSLLSKHNQWLSNDDYADYGSLNESSPPSHISIVMLKTFLSDKAYS